MFNVMNQNVQIWIIFAEKKRRKEFFFCGSVALTTGDIS